MQLNKIPNNWIPIRQIENHNYEKLDYEIQITQNNKESQIAAF